MASVTVRPFASMASCRQRATLQPNRLHRVKLAPIAAAKGFGDPKKEPSKRSGVSQGQDQGAASSSSSFNAAPPAATPRARVVQETPQVVVDRIFRRILVCSIVPVFTGMALFPVFYWLRVVLDIEYPLWIVYVAQVLTFGGGILGISFGALSASWDPNREGSALGFTELQANIAFLLSKKD